MDPASTLRSFDEFLARRGLRLDAVVIGGTALNLLGVVARATKDCDVIAPSLSEEILDAARSFADGVRRTGGALDAEWLNNGPAALAEQLPDGWRERLQPLFSGKAITLRSLGREDLLRSKLFALCDRGIDLSDCIALAPTEEELRTIIPWLVAQDGNPDWPDHVRATIADVARRLGRGV